MAGSPDPVSDPSRYQALLVSLVADDDPAEVQQQTPELLRSLVADAADHVAARPEPGEWSVLECIAHIVDAEIVSTGRYRWIVAHDEPELMPYDQDLWVDRLHARSERPEDLIHLFETLREANLELWARTPEAGRGRIGLHRERGPESYRLTFTLIAGHDRFHLAQANRALQQLRLGR